MDFENLLAQYLIDNGFATGMGQDIFLDNLPDAPDDSIAIIEYQGLGLQNGSVASNRNFQIITRSRNLLDAKKKNWKIFRFLNPSDKDDDYITYFGGTYAVITANGNPFKLRIDENNRVEFVCNYTILTMLDSY